MSRLLFPLIFCLFAGPLFSQQVVVASDLFRNTTEAIVFTSSISGRVIDSKYFSEENPAASEYVSLLTNQRGTFHLTILLRGRPGFSDFTQTFAKTLWRCQQDTLRELEIPDYIPRSLTPEFDPLGGRSRARFTLAAQPAGRGKTEPMDVPLRTFSLRNFPGSRFDFFGVDCKFMDLRKLGGLRDATFKNFRFSAYRTEPHQFLIFDQKEKAFRELYLPATVTADSTYWQDFGDLPFSPPPVVFSLEAYHKPQAQLSAVLDNGEIISLGKIGPRCQEEELVQHPLVSGRTVEYRKFLRYYVDQTETDFTTITRAERSAFLEDFNFTPVDYRPVNVALNNATADLSRLPPDMVNWEVFFLFPGAGYTGGQRSRTPDWYYKSGRSKLIPPSLEGEYSWSVSGTVPGEKVALPTLPEGAARVFFAGKQIGARRVTGVSFSANLAYEKVAYGYWLLPSDDY